MINASDAFKQKLQDGKKVWQEVEITFPDGTVKTVKDEIMGENCTFSDCAENSSFPIGCVICKSMTLELDNASDQWKNYNFYMAKVHAYLKMQTSVASPAVTDELLDENYEPILDQSDSAILTTKAATEDRIETIDKGVYTITTPEQYGEILSFTALDDMYKANATYTSKLVLPQTIINLVRDACDTLSIPFGGIMQHGNLIISEIPENMTFRQLFGWAAMLETANARLDNKGYLQFIKWDFSNVQEDYGAIADADGSITFKGGASIDSDNFISPAGNWTIDNDGFLTLIESATDTSEKLKDFFTSPTVSSDDIIITGIKLKNRENESMYGSTGYVLGLENDLIADSDLDTVSAQIGDSIIGVKFRNMSGELAYNPLIEFGDMAYTYDRRWNRYITPLTDVSCSVNGKTTVKTQADDPIRGMSKFVSDGTKAIVEARRLTKIEKTEREKAIERLAGMLVSSSGLYMTQEPQQDGSIVYYMHNKSTLEESDIIWKLTAEAFAVSVDGGKTYPYGFAVTGELITRLLYAEGINATYIDAGVLTVKDKSGKVIFMVDMDKKSVYMDPDTLTIGGMPLSKKLENMDENIASAKNMTFQLSNDMQTITSDADGNIPVFPTVATTAKVMYGSSDITNDCSYTVTKSDSVTGSWDVDTHTYTVTGLSADNGWVDIRAVYLDNLAVTKRFTITKQKQGEDGIPGRNYIIEPSCSVLKRNADKIISPNFLEFKAFYRDGNEAERHPYSGRFLIEETSDGETWTTIYTSSTDENTVKHYLYSILTDGSGQTVTDENGTTVGIPRDVTNIRCRLYQAGGTVNQYDMQSVAVVIDVDNLTQTEIIRILSDNGKWNGLYYKNGKLYISFSAAMGGELTLGGKNNGNGFLQINNIYDIPKALVDYSGFTCYTDHSVNDQNITEYVGINFSDTGIHPVKASKKLPEEVEVEFEEVASVGSDDIDVEFEDELSYWGVTINTLSDGTQTLDIDMQILNAEEIYANSAYIKNLGSFSTDAINCRTVTATGTIGGDYGAFTSIYSSSSVKTDGEVSGKSLEIHDNASVRGDLSCNSFKIVEIAGKTTSAINAGLRQYSSSSGDDFQDAWYRLCEKASSSKRYKDLGDSITPEELKNWYNIEPLWAKYKDGYLVKGDENEGRYIPMFIAEDVEEYFPEATRHANGLVEDWNERIMIPAMFAMIKSQKSEIDLLKQELNEIKQLLRKE